jgi:hypothetical protein
MLYKQHRHIGNSIVVGGNVRIPGSPRAAGRIGFARVERIDLTDMDFYEELKRYNVKLDKRGLDWFRERVEHGALSMEVRRTFGDVNAWAGDHAKLHPPDGELLRFADLGVRLQEVANIHDLGYLALASSNWDHFMPMSYRVWWVFHREALRLARRWFASGARGAFRPGLLGGEPGVVFDLDKTDVARALFLEAYAGHFLEDCFTSGHLRTPRLLFGAEPVQGIMSKGMHDEDNGRRLESCNAKGEFFRLCGEDGDADDFARRTGDAVLARLEEESVATLAASVQQVLDVAFDGVMPGKVRFEDVSDRMPRVRIWWSRLSAERSRTHSLEIWPVPGTVDTPKPLYKIHADYDRKRKRFVDPILIKRTREGSWRRVPLVDVRLFTPGEKLAWWIPAHPDGDIELPA